MNILEMRISPCEVSIVSKLFLPGLRAIKDVYLTLSGKLGYQIETQVITLVPNVVHIITNYFFIFTPIEW